MKKSDPKLEQLKSLLLADELARLEELVSKVEALEFETLDQEAIKRKLLPLFDDLLLERLRNKERRTVEILSEYLSEIITQSALHDPQALSRSLQEVISPAIAQSIADNKEKMIDTLYPIMGGMISKYVTQAIKELMETINRKIERGVSIEGYKRKVKAKLTGVSESELLLEESADAEIEAMFVIHKETGLLISEAHLENSQIGDPHMVASMASAIKDFINDWIAENKGASDEIEILSYGNETLYIESAGSVYLIAFLDGEPDYEQRSDINVFFASLLNKYADYFQIFDGDDSDEKISEISKKMYAYLLREDAHTPILEETRRNPAKILLILIGVLYLGYIGYTLKKHYDIQQLSEMILKQTGEVVQIDQKKGEIQLKGLIKDPSRINEIRKIVQKRYSDEKLKDSFALSATGVDRLVSGIDQKQNAYLKKLQTAMDKKLHTLQEKVDTLKNNLYTSREEKRELSKLLSMESKIESVLGSQMAGDLYYHPQNSILNFAPLHLFAPGASEPEKEKMQTMIASVFRYLSALAPYRSYIKQITIYSYSDSGGKTDENLRLTQKRAEMIKHLLLGNEEILSLDMEELFKTIGKGEENPIMINGVEDKNASRRIEIGYILDREKIKKEIVSLIQEVETNKERELGK